MCFKTCFYVYVHSSADYGHSQIRETTLKKWLKEWGLQSSRKQAHTFETIAEPIQELKIKFPTAGASTMQGLLRTDFGMRVPKDIHLSPSCCLISPQVQAVDLRLQQPC